MTKEELAESRHIIGSIMSRRSRALLDNCVDQIERLQADNARLGDEIEVLINNNTRTMRERDECKVENARLVAAVRGLVTAIETVPKGTAKYADAFQAAKIAGTNSAALSALLEPTIAVLTKCHCSNRRESEQDIARLRDLFGKKD